MTSSDAVVKSVAKKLKYYFDVKRLEEGFDLSDTNAPILDHPPLKARPTLQYEGLHDRPLKHYFSQPEVRIQLTQMGATEPHLKNPREKTIKRTILKNMKKHHFLKSSIPDCYYVRTSSGRKIHPSLVGFGASPKSMKDKSLKRGWPVLRSVPPVNISRGEAERLVNSASKLLAATETVEQLVKTHPGPSWAQPRQSAPRSLEAPSKDGKRRPLTAKYTWDINGHKVRTEPVKAYDDSYVGQVARHQHDLHRSSSSASSEESEPSIHRPSPRPPRPPSPPPHSKHPLPTQQRESTIINLPEERIRDEVKIIKPEPPKVEAGIQTERYLLDNYDPMEVEVKDGPWAEYHVTVMTGDRTGASTKADIYLTIYGDKGCTPPLKLNTSKYNKVKFQRGKEDLFIFTAHHVGKMKKIKIGHDRMQLSYAWFLENVTITDRYEKKIYDFPCSRWLSGQDDDRRTYCLLPVDRIRSLIDTLEKPVPDSSRFAKTEPSKISSASSSSDLKIQSKDRISMKPKPSQRSRSSSSSSSRSSSPPVQVKNETQPVQRHEEDFPAPRTVIHFKKKGSQIVEEEVVLNQEFLAAYKAGIEAGELSERKYREEERRKERELLTGPTIHDACHNGDLERVKQLLDVFPELKDSKDESGWIPLHLAAASGHEDVIMWLTSAGGDNLDEETPTGYTPLHVAAMNGHVNAIKVLNAMGADLSCKTIDGQTPLHLAARQGHLESVKWLVANGSQINSQDSFGKTPLELAEEYQHHTVLDFLRVCERDLTNPNSTFAQMRAVHQQKGSVKMPAIREDDNGSGTSEAVLVGSSSTIHNSHSHDREKQLSKRREVYKKQHQDMENKGLSFLDSIRTESEN